VVARRTWMSYRYKQDDGSLEAQAPKVPITQEVETYQRLDDANRRRPILKRRGRMTIRRWRR
jgi:hypothetical protein